MADFLGSARAEEIQVLAHGYALELPIQCVPEIVRLLVAENIAVYQVVRLARPNAVRTLSPMSNERIRSGPAVDTRARFFAAIRAGGVPDAPAAHQQHRYHDQKEQDEGRMKQVMVENFLQH
jgi:hypothetical protein